jgi:hypothetical protein
MLVKIQLLRDDGSVALEHVGNAFHPSGWEAPIEQPVIGGAGEKLAGFCYIPSPPPSCPAELAEFGRRWAAAFAD